MKIMMKRGLMIISFLNCLLLFGCEKMALLTPKGEIGLQQRNLILISLCLMLLVVIPAIFMAIHFFLKYREGNDAEYLPNWSHSNKIEFVVWTVPIIIIAILGTITWFTSHSLDPYKPIESDVPPVNIQVISLDWKWLFIYPDYGIATVNEIAFPVNTPIAFKVTSDTVMNSFFIPRLGSQIYTMAGMQTQLNLIANESGEFKGISSGYSGHGFSDMKFTAIATKDNSQFLQWINKVKASKQKLTSAAEYDALAEPSYGYPVTYYHQVKPELYEDIINKYMDMDMENHHHHSSNAIGVTAHAR